MTDRQTKLKAVLFSALMVTSMAVGGVALFTGQAAAQTPLADAPDGTVFNELRPGGDAASATDIGLIKRGASGERLYNPSTDRETIQPGDILIARDGTDYIATRAQTIPGSGGFAGPGATLYQGEQDTNLINFQSDTLVGVPDQGAEGETLDINQTIPLNQETGVYQDPATGQQITIQEPRISRLEMVNQNGQRIDDGGELKEDEFIIVRADVNFLGSERARMSLLSPNTGSRITDGLLSRQEAIDRFPDRADFIRNFVPAGKAELEGEDGTVHSIANPANSARDTVYLIQDLSEVDKAGAYEYEVVSDENEPFGDLSQNGLRRTVGFNLVSSDEPQISFTQGNGTAVQGEFISYQVERSSAGNHHAVSIAAEDLRNRPSGEVRINQVTPVFRQFDDGGFTRGVLLDDGRAILEDGRVYENGQLVTETGPSTVDGSSIREVFTTVEVDTGGLGINQLETGRLDDTSVDVNLFDAFASAEAAVQDYENEDGGNEIEEITLTVGEGTEGLTIQSPGAEYTAGDDIDVEGTANPAIDFVSLYARDQGDWELISPSLESVPVDADGTWDEPDVVLSQESRILRVPGNYRIGLIDSEDADLDGDGTVESQLSTSEFSQGTSYQRGIRVTGQELTANLETYGGQVAVEDGTVNVNGIAEGAEEVLIVFMDDQGNVVVERDTVDDNDEFEDEDVPLSDQTGELSEGPVRAFVISPARDNVYGKSGEGPDSTQEFISFVNDLEQRGLTQEQIISLIRDESVDDQGSDDILVEFDFQLTDADTTITDIYPSDMEDGSGIMELEPGEEFVIQGTTNLRPDDNTIVVEVIEGASANMFEVAVADDWNTSGQWSATLAVPADAETGTYVIRADDGETITSVNVEVVDQREEPTTTTTTTTTTTEPETTTTTTTTATTTDTTTTTTTTTTDGTPGFTVVVMVMALVLGVALLAARRMKR